MLKNRDIIFFGEDWGRFPSTTQHIAKELLPQNRIMWIGSLAHRRPTFSLADAKRVIEKVKKVFASHSVPKRFNEKSPIQINPFIIPLHDNRVVRKLNAILLRKKLKRALEDHQFNNPIIITSSPLIGDILGELGETSSHYLCLDDYSHFKGAFGSILQLEKKMLKKISASFSVSDFLVESRKPANGPSYFLPQGVQANHFVKYEDKIPNDMKVLKKPVIGFFGLVSEFQKQFKIFLKKKIKSEEKQQIGLRIIPLLLCFYFVMTNIAMLIGIFRFFTNKQTAFWQSTPR